MMNIFRTIKSVGIGIFLIIILFFFLRFNIFNTAPNSESLHAYERVNHVEIIVPIDLSDSNWSHGFATFGPIFLLNKSDVEKLGYGVSDLLTGERIEFSDQQIRTITQIKVIGEYLHVTYSGNRIYQENLKNRIISVMSEKLQFDAYSKKFGLKGIIFSYLYNFIPDFIKNASGIHGILNQYISFIFWYLFFITFVAYLIYKYMISNIEMRFQSIKDKIFSRMKLAQNENSKNNNFTLLRTILAIAVLFGHSFPIVGKGSDPISVAVLQPTEWIGSMAVNGFFFISGFLVVGSFVRRGAINYILSRVLRLYPAVLVYSVIAILFIGPIFSSVGLDEYFKARPWFNLINAGLWQWSHNLPYIFQSNPIPGATNGSAWTLPAELRSYILICFIGFFGALDTRIRANFSLIGLLLLCKFYYTDLPMFGGNTSFQVPLIYFLTGSIYWINKDIIPMNRFVAVFCCLLTALSIKFGFLYFLLPIFMGYVLLTFVYKLPCINIDRIGDLSYGIYIYAWPVQQLVWYSGQGPYENFFISLFLVSTMAFLSWRFIEKPALGLRSKLVFKS